MWEGSDVGMVTTKNDITAGDGAKHDIMSGKAELATRTTCNVFECLRSKGVPVAYIGRDGPTTFLTKICNMIPVEVVCRHIAGGSYLKRHPDVPGGTVFENPVVEFFYKTNGRQIGIQKLPCDDPLMSWNDTHLEYRLYLPNQPQSDGYISHLALSDTETFKRQLEECGALAIEIGTHLAEAWRKLDGNLEDFKVEFGILPDGTIVLADVVDCDSWRVTWNGIQLSKQGYRDGEKLDRVLGVYRLAASLTDRFV